MNQQLAPRYIDSDQTLQEFCVHIKDATWLTLDTEFLREKTYYPKFCLLQIATENTAACIDPITLQSLAPLIEILYDPHITKVFHSGRQDLEIFFHLYGKLPTPIFDTQIAAPLLGLAEQISYGGLVSEILGVTLSKAHSRTDWSRRPLSPEQLRYAADDVIYLADVYRKMLPRLEQLGRLEWLQKDFDDLTEPNLYQNPPAEAWQRLSGAFQLKNKALSVLQTLAAWREETAKAQDIPRGWLLKDDSLFDLARQQPADLHALQSVRGIDERVVKRHGAQLCQLIQDALARPPASIELKNRPPRKTAEQEALLDLLMAVVRLRAAKNTLNPAALASRKDLEQLLDGDADARLLKGWRKSMVGEDLAAVMRGELSLKVIEDNLQLVAHA